MQNGLSKPYIILTKGDKQPKETIIEMATPNNSDHKPIVIT